MVKLIAKCLLSLFGWCGFDCWRVWWCYFVRCLYVKSCEVIDD